MRCANLSRRAAWRRPINFMRYSLEAVHPPSGPRSRLSISAQRHFSEASRSGCSQISRGIHKPLKPRGIVSGVCSKFVWVFSFEGGCGNMGSPFLLKVRNYSPCGKSTRAFFLSARVVWWGHLMYSMRVLFIEFVPLLWASQRGLFSFLEIGRLDTLAPLVQYLLGPLSFYSLQQQHVWFSEERASLR